MMMTNNAINKTWNAEIITDSTVEKMINEV